MLVCLAAVPGGALSLRHAPSLVPEAPEEHEEEEMPEQMLCPRWSSCRLGLLFLSSPPTENHKKGPVFESNMSLKSGSSCFKKQKGTQILPSASYQTETYWPEGSHHPDLPAESRIEPVSKEDKPKDDTDKCLGLESQQEKLVKKMSD